MAEQIFKFGGIDAISRTESERGESEPEQDPRGRQGTSIYRGMHLMSAVEQLQPAGTTKMAYFDPDSPLADKGLEEVQRLVRDHELDLSEVLTVTNRFTPLVNPRRSRKKGAGEVPRDSDADLWHVPTSNYQAMPPRTVFSPLASAVDASDNIDNSGVYGEFRERRNGGEVSGDIWFEDFSVGEMDDDPVLLGFKVGWSYFGDRAFYYQPYAQQTRCKNSVAPLDDKNVVMHHNKSVDFREVWEEALSEMGLYADELTNSIQDARRIVFEFSGTLAGENDTDAIPIPMGVEAFYESIGMPDPRIPADHAREESEASDLSGTDATNISAWHLHAGATYWLSWHWNGSEDSQAFRGYRRTANDLLLNPHQIADRAARSYEEDERERVIREVVGPDGSYEDASDEERDEIESILNDHEGIATISSSTETVQDMVEEFQQTEERLDRVQEAISGGE